MLMQLGKLMVLLKVMVEKQVGEASGGTDRASVSTDDASDRPD